MIVHPRYLFGALNPSEYESYKQRNRVRYRLSYKAMSDMMIGNSLVKVKDHPPYSPELEGPVLLNSQARTSYDTKTGSYAFTSKLQKSAVYDTANAKAVTELVEDEGIECELRQCTTAYAFLDEQEAELLKKAYDDALELCPTLKDVTYYGPEDAERNGKSAKGMRECQVALNGSLEPR